MNVLIIGLGSIARKHIHALNLLAPDARIYSLRSQRDASEEDNITNIYGLEDAGIIFDFAIISNPTAAHFETINQLLRLNIPLFIEKPLFHTLENGQNLVDECINRNIPTYVACNLRFHPCIHFLKDYLKDKQQRINEVNVYCGSYLPDWRAGQDFRKIYSSIPELGGGVHLDLIHELDYTSWLLGGPQKVQKILRNSSALGIPAIDFAHYSLFYPNYTANITLNYYRRDAKRSFEVLLDDATLFTDLIGNKITIGGEVIFSEATDIYYTYVKQMDYFLNGIQRNQPMMNNISEAFDILKMCLQ